MKLDKKKKLAAKVLNVGIGRILFDNSRLDEIKEAITRQDIKDLEKNKVIKIKIKKGRRKAEKRKRRGPGRTKKKVKKRKKEYMLLTRKLRKYASELKKQGRVDRSEYREIRKKIKSRIFKNKKHLKEYLRE